MSAEMTPATKRAYAAADEAAVSVTPPEGVSMEAWLDEHGTLAYRHGMAHAALAAALDVEDMARELFVADSWQDRDFVLGIWRMAPDDQAVKKHWRRIATAIRTALLGADS